MDMSGRLRLSHLRAVLVAGRLEKSRLAYEIKSSDTTPGRKRQAVYRYSKLVKELRMTARELEAFLATTHAETPKHLDQTVLHRHA